jgi:hypothetical protein|tara:strand:- start:203 stop:466 length:264 start_codon:yes stop_codon:yes gene_type:complete
MSKVKKTVKKTITKEQLEKITKQQSRLSESLRSIGVLEVQKDTVKKIVIEVSKEIEDTKKELENEYGQVNIDLTDGSYTDIEKKNEE